MLSGPQLYDLSHQNPEDWALHWAWFVQDLLWRLTRLSCKCMNYELCLHIAFLFLWFILCKFRLCPSSLLLPWNSRYCYVLLCVLIFVMLSAHLLLNLFSILKLIIVGQQVLFVFIFCFIAESFINSSKMNGYFSCHIQLSIT